MADAFADYKGVIKSYNPMRNVPERVEVPNKTTQLPSKRGRSTAISTDAASSKQRKNKNKSSNPVNATQPQAEEHPMDYNLHIPHQQSTQLLMLGHQNALMQPFWEMMMRQEGYMKFSSIISSLENHMTERLQLLTFISPQ